MKCQKAGRGRAEAVPRRRWMQTRRPEPVRNRTQAFIFQFLSIRLLAHQGNQAFYCDFLGSARCQRSSGGRAFGAATCVVSAGFFHLQTTQSIHTLLHIGHLRLDDDAVGIVLGGGKGR